MTVTESKRDEVKDSVLAPWRKANNSAEAKSISYRFLDSGKDTFFPYSQLIWAHHWPSVGIIVHYATHTVYIRGQRLFPLFVGIRDQLVSEVAFDSMQSAEEVPGEPVISSIQIMQKGSDPEPFKFPEPPATE